MLISLIKKSFYFTAFIICNVFLTGCLVLPNPVPIKDVDEVEKLTIGQSSREEVIRLLEEPNVAEAPDLLVYHWEKDRAFLIVGGPGFGSVTGFSPRFFQAMFLFDSNGLLTGVQTMDSRTLLTLPPAEAQLFKLEGLSMFATGMSLSYSAGSDEIVALYEDQGNSTGVILIGNPRSDQAWTKLSDPAPKGGITKGESSPCIALSSDSRFVAIARPKRPLVVWELGTGSAARELENFESKRFGMRGARPVLFSPDGSRLVSFDVKGALTVWDVASSDIIFRSVETYAFPASLAFSPDGSLLAIGFQYGGFTILSLASGEVIVPHRASFLEHGQTAVAFSPDEKWFATSTLVHMEIWHTGTWTRERVALLPVTKPHKISDVIAQSGYPGIWFSPDSRAVAVKMPCALSFHDVQTLESLGGASFYDKVMPDVGALDSSWTRFFFFAGRKIGIWDVPKPLWKSEKSEDPTEQQATHPLE